MSRKLQIIVAFCLIAFVKAEVYLSVDGEESYGNKIDDLLRRLEAAVDKAMVDAQQALDKAKAELATYAEKYEADADTQMAADEKKWTDDLAQLKEQAKQKNIDISSCLGDNESKLNQEQAVYHANMVNCVSEDIADGTKYAQGALDKIKSLVSEVENVKKEIKDCGGGFKGAKCLAKLAVKIERDVTNLPQEIELAATETALAIAKLQPKVKSCASDAASNCESTGQQLFNTIATCINSKNIFFMF